MEREGNIIVTLGTADTVAVPAVAEVVLLDRREVGGDALRVVGEAVLFQPAVREDAEEQPVVRAEFPPVDEVDVAEEALALFIGEPPEEGVRGEEQSRANRRVLDETLVSVHHILPPVFGVSPGAERVAVDVTEESLVRVAAPKREQPPENPHTPLVLLCDAGIVGAVREIQKACAAGREEGARRLGQAAQERGVIRTGREFVGKIVCHDRSPFGWLSGI